MREKCEVIALYNAKSGEISPFQLLRLASTILRVIQHRIQKRRVIGQQMLEHIVFDSDNRTSLIELGVIATQEDLRLLTDLIRNQKGEHQESLQSALEGYLDYLKLPKTCLKNLGTKSWYGEKPIDFSKDYDSVDDLIGKNELKRQG